MTWREFKARVEQQGVKDMTEIAWIDVLGWMRAPHVVRNPDGTVIIVQRDGK